MDPEIDQLLRRLARQPGQADRFFADPAAFLAPLDFSDEDKQALARIDREALLYLDAADTIEPAIAPEHPDSRRDLGWITLVIAFGGCVAYVLIWLISGGAPS